MENVVVGERSNWRREVSPAVCKQWVRAKKNLKPATYMKENKEGGDQTGRGFSQRPEVKSRKVSRATESLLNPGGGGDGGIYHRPAGRMGTERGKKSKIEIEKRRDR